mgnify:CR=1 FL=1
MTKSIMVDLDDPRIDNIADVISNKTSKKILTILSEQELSETDLSKNLNIPLNTIGYSIDKLEQVGLIEKAKDFYWSVKGKKIHKYKISNKRIVISPKSMIKGIIPSIIVVSIITLGIKIFTSSQKVMTENIAPSASEVLKAVEPSQIASIPSVLANMTWAWFLLGGLIALLILVLWNLKNERRSNEN